MAILWQGSEEVGLLVFIYVVNHDRAIVETASRQIVLGWVHVQAHDPRVGLVNCLGVGGIFQTKTRISGGSIASNL